MWSLSNTPQAYLNFKRKSVSGFSIEYQLWNMIGFLCYLVYTTTGFYFQHKWDLVHSIAYQDIIFASCTFTVVYTIGVQAFILYPSTISGKIHIVHQALMFGLVIIGLYNILLGITGHLPWFSHEESAYAYSVIQYLGMGKSFVSCVKYIPQAYLNYKAQSTHGYNIVNACFDLCGGTCSFLQMVVNAYAYPNAEGNPNWEHIFSNVPKLVLAVESVTFDIIFFFQHFVLYAHNNKLRAMEEQNAAAALSAEENTPFLDSYVNPSVQQQY